MKVAFEAFIHNIDSRSLVCGEKQTKLTLRLQDKNVPDHILNPLNSLHKADTPVWVVLMDEANE